MELLRKLPKCIVQYLFINYLDIGSISNIVKYYPKLFSETQKESLRRIKRGFEYCCSNGYLEEAKIVYSLEKVKIGTLNMAFIKCCYKGYINVAQWLYMLRKVVNDSSIDYINKGQENVIFCDKNSDEREWMIEGVRIPINNQGAFYYSCIMGHLNIAKWLYSVDLSIDISFEANIIFSDSCVKNCLEVVKWLYSINPDQYKNSRKILYDLFFMCCREGHIDMVKWIYSINSGIFEQYDKSYEYGIVMNICLDGHIEIAKFLYTINKDIFKYLDIVTYSIICYNNHLELIKWIYTVTGPIDNNIIDEIIRNSRSSPEIKDWLLSVRT